MDASPRLRREWGRRTRIIATPVGNAPRRWRSMRCRRLLEVSISRHRRGREQRALPATLVARAARETRIPIPGGDRLNSAAWQVLDQWPRVADGAIGDGTFDLPAISWLGIFRLRVGAGDRRTPQPLIVIAPDRLPAIRGAVATQVAVSRSSSTAFGRAATGAMAISPISPIWCRLAARGRCRRGRPQSAARAVRRPAGAGQPLFAQQPTVPQPALHRPRRRPGISRRRRPPGLPSAIARLRQQDLRRLWRRRAPPSARACGSPIDSFRDEPNPDRRADFDAFRNERGDGSPASPASSTCGGASSACGGNGRRNGAGPMTTAIAALRDAEADDVGFYEFVQWIARPPACALLRRRARRRPAGRPLSRPRGRRRGRRAPTPGASRMRCSPACRIGAPPDMLNTAGRTGACRLQSASGSKRSSSSRSRRCWQPSMRYAGAIRLDHVLGLIGCSSFPTA